MKRPMKFRQGDVTRATKGAMQAGMNVTRVEIDADGKITLMTGTQAPEPATAFDAWKGKQNARQA